MLLFLALACTAGDDSTATSLCTEIGCVDGLTVGFTPALSGKGTYRFDVTVDATPYSCTVTIPLGDSSTVCDSGGVVSVFLSGSELPVAEQTLPGLHVDGTPVSVQVQVHRDDAIAIDAKLEPKYQTLQPNGPDCEPTCRSAGVEIATD